MRQIRPYNKVMLVAAAAAIMGLQEGRTPIPPKKDWPVFQGQRPVSKPLDGAVRYWLFSFPAKFEEVVAKASADLKAQGYKEDATREREGHDVVFSKGPYVIYSVAVWDNSFTITRNKKVSTRHPERDSWQRLVSAEGWVTVVRAESTMVPLPRKVASSASKNGGRL